MSCVLACVGFGPSECRNTQGAIQSKHSFVWIIIFNLSPSDQLHNIIGLQKKVLDNKKGTPCQKVIMRALENWKRFHNIFGIKKMFANKIGTPCQRVIMRALENWKKVSWYALFGEAKVWPNILTTFSFLFKTLHCLNLNFNCLNLI